MPDGEEPVVEPTLESLHADVKAQSTLLRKLATALAQLTARDRVLLMEMGHMAPGQRVQGAGADEDVVLVDAGVAAKVSTHE
eukprot:jgi/Tetstr1/441193/TSEL_029449.t1